MTPSKIPVAVIGAGIIGRSHITRVNRLADFSLAAIVEPSDAGRDLAASLNIPWFAEPQSMLRQMRPAGAIVATPNQTHLQITKDCLDAGVATLLEKPIADTVLAAQALVEHQQRTGVPVLIGHHRRHNPINRRARAIIESGKLGRIVGVSALATMFKPEPYFNVQWRRQAGGGPILINLIHDIDMLRYLVGDIAAVQGFASHEIRKFPVEDSAAAVLRFANGALGTVLVSDSTVSPWSWDFCAGEQDHYTRQTVQTHFITGTHGSLSLPDLQLWNYQGERDWFTEITCQQSFVHKGDPYDLQMANFKAIIEGRDQPLCSAMEGLRTLQATLAIKDASRSGQAVIL
jgi:predicted dehydrogenase